ncbi:MAG: exo-alpha-sialidase [Blastocatellia bacterium]|nr:exo-alpha-sialidase [Blastocatellia bacterium]MBL8194601.1 exo-alpha-sialidase [Blastocatellia bacterium]MBN8721333.1 exo-alpha-sialidase [Acidobacteriota bacterium]
MKLLLILIALCFSLVLPLNTNAQQINQLTQIQGLKNSHSIKMGSNNMLHLVYDNSSNTRNATLPAASSIVYQQSLDNGQSFSRPILISQRILSSFNPDVAVGTNGTIYVIWSGVNQSGRSIFLAKSTNNGLSFSIPQQISSLGSGQAPKIAIDSNNNIYVAYFTGSLSTGLVVTRSTDGGNNFSEPQQVSNIGEFAIPTNLLFDSQRNVYLFYADGSTATTYLVKSLDGVNFALPKVIATNEIGFFTSPKAFINAQNNIFVAFSSGSQIIFTKSLDQGATFSEPVAIADSIGAFPAIVVDRNNNINIAWQEGADINNIFFARSQNGGASFSAKTRLSVNSNFSFGVLGIRDANGDSLFSWISGALINGDLTNTNVFATILDSPPPINSRN